MNPKPLYQQIKTRFQLGPASHMTHIENLASIVQAGELRSYNRMIRGTYRDLSNEDVQSGRAKKEVPVTGRPLHDYVPLYFGPKTPMVAWNQDRNEDILFIRFSLNILADGDLVIADGNARSSRTRFRIYRAIEDLDFLNPAAINAVKYAHDPELKRQKQAEILIPDVISLTKALDIICFSNEQKGRILEVLNRYDRKLPVWVQPGKWYFVPRPAKGGVTP